MKFMVTSFVLIVLGVSFAKVLPPLPKNSIYHVQSSWKDQNSKAVQLKDLSGQKIIIGMVYTQCPHTCPMIISKIKNIEKQISESSAAGEKYKIVLASFDVKRDTPEHLKKYMKKHSLDESRWVFLSAGSEAVVRELAVVLNINFKELEDGEFSHSNVISLLDKNGVRVERLESLSSPVTSMVNAFKN